MHQVIHRSTIDLDNIRKQLFILSKSYSIFSILDSNNWQHDQYNSYDVMAAFGAAKEIGVNSQNNSFENLRKEHQKKPNWMFGYFSYDLKNELENLQSNNHDAIEASKMYFFVPKLLILIKDQNMDILIHDDYIDDLSIRKNIDLLFTEHRNIKNNKQKKVHIQHRINQVEYLNSIKKIQQHIKQGDIYELNFCQEFYAQDVEIDTIDIYGKLAAKSPTPFSAFMRFNNIHLMSSSPERYLKKISRKIISQPIKGTSRRQSDKRKDLEAIDLLKNNSKERAENIMIVDLVRNDLARTAKKGSVKVEELCEIYSFKQVHQMTSTISSELDDKYDFVDLLRTTFPMGSMTGAPKIRAMELIEKYEQTKRGIYSGAIGYITPDGDFDFNVVIRSLIYNSQTKYLSFIAGGAITYQSNPQLEYEESLLKVEAIINILS